MVGDLDPPESLKAAFSGGFGRGQVVSTPDERMVARECAFIDAAKAAGFQRVVRLGAYLTGPDAPTKNLRDHAMIDPHRQASGTERTVRRPHGFLQTFVLISLDFVKGAGLYLPPRGTAAWPSWTCGTWASRAPMC